MNGSVDTGFSHAVHSVVRGDAQELMKYLRSDKPLGAPERERIALMAERCAELARGDIGGDIGRPEMGAYSPKVWAVVRDFDSRFSKDMQKSQAKAEVAEAHNISCRTVENYLRLHGSATAAHFRLFRSALDNANQAEMEKNWLACQGISNKLLAEYLQQNKE